MEVQEFGKVQAHCGHLRGGGDDLGQIASGQYKLQTDKETIVYVAI